MIERIARHTDSLPALAPRHVALALRGYDRWAQTCDLDLRSRGLVARDALVASIDAALQHGVAHLTFIAVVTDAERAASLVDVRRALAAKNVRFVAPASARLSTTAAAAFHALEGATLTASGLRVTVALVGDARSELVAALRSLARDVVAGRPIESIDDDTIGAYLPTAGTPDPDLLVQTGGDLRIDDALLYQIAYAELYATPTPWPVFDAPVFDRAVAEYARRHRRFGC